MLICRTQAAGMLHIHSAGIGLFGTDIFLPLKQCLTFRCIATAGRNIDCFEMFDVVVELLIL
jgi:hypothetical protein